MSVSRSTYARVARKKLCPAELWAREEAAAKRHALEELLAQHIHAWGLPQPEREYHFHETRGWRMDFAWPAFMVAAEVEGLTPTGGRHQRMAGFEKDTEKLNAAAQAGWKVLRFTGGQIRKAYAVRELEQALTKASRERGGVA